MFTILMNVSGNVPISIMHLQPEVAILLYLSTALLRQFCSPIATTQEIAILYAAKIRIST